MRITTKSGKKIQLPTSEEDRKITDAALSDPDARPSTEEELATAKQRMGRGRPISPITKERITIRLTRSVVDQFRATGTGWQTRMDEALQDWLKDHRPA